ncbi:hypothetical protein [Pararhizobium sp. LjRoot238]|uniref:hypothetical protein n=1 Tax=Pararhizobium sp. LjRoot238 TaxID=3342293 RepID=UPI003ECEBD4E
MAIDHHGGAMAKISVALQSADSLADAKATVCETVQEWFSSTGLYGSTRTSSSTPGRRDETTTRQLESLNITWREREIINGAQREKLRMKSPRS